MPDGKHTVELPVTIGNIWAYVSDIDRWAPLVPGYIEHQIISDRQSTWSFKGDLGFMKKTVKMRIDITEWTEPTRVTFNLTGLSDNFAGNGFFEAEELGGARTRMTGYLNVEAKGPMGPMINQILKSFVPKTAEELTAAVAGKILEVQGASP